MKKQEEKICDAIFVIVNEEACPLYNVGEEITVESYGISMSNYKAPCLYLAQKVASIVSSKKSFTSFSGLPTTKTRYDCGGCEGLIQFEYKKDRGFATLQMKLLEEAEKKRRKKHLERYFKVLREIKMFDSLEDDALSDLTLLLQFQTIPFGKIVVKKGTPSTNVFIILDGQVEVRADDGTKLVDFGAGEMFGEMSLLSAEPCEHSIASLATTQLAILSVKNFKEILHKYPVLQMFLFKLLVDRAQALTLKSGKIASGMTGELSEIAPIDLFQLINAAQKTGIIDIALEKGRGMVFFREGQIVYAGYRKLRREDAVYLILGMTSGHFSYTKGLPKELQKAPPLANFMGMMMKGIQSLDDN